MMNNLQMPYVLVINNEMFISNTFLVERPRPKQIVNVLGTIYICINKDICPKLNEPVIAEIDTTRHAPVSICKEALLRNGFRQLSHDEIKELKHQFLNDCVEEELLVY